MRSHCLAAMWKIQSWGRGRGLAGCEKGESSNLAVQTHVSVVVEAAHAQTGKLAPKKPELATVCGRGGNLVC